MLIKNYNKNKIVKDFLDKIMPIYFSLESKMKTAVVSLFRYYLFLSR